MYSVGKECNFRYLHIYTMYIVALFTLGLTPHWVHWLVYTHDTKGCTVVHSTWEQNACISPECDYEVLWLVYSCGARFSLAVQCISACIIYVHVLRWLWVHLWHIHQISKNVSYKALRYMCMPDGVSCRLDVHVHCTIFIMVYLCVCLCRSSAGIQQSLLVTESVQDTGTEWLEYVDPNEPRYCLCNQVGATISLSCNCYGEIFIVRQ